jgi:dienelactone hydrolase
MTAMHERHRRASSGTAVSESVVRFGDADQLVGILSQPEQPRAGAPVVVILNAGVLHRVGPHRLHVVLARRLAATGVTCLRLDLGGIGDSTNSSDATTFRESAVNDTRLVLRTLVDRIGATRFVIFGVCAGADNAIATALVDDRVAGIVVVDPHTYPSKRGRLRSLYTKLSARSPRESVRWIAKVAERRARAAIDRLRALRDRAEAPEEEGRTAPPLSQFRSELGTLVSRGVKILAIYSGIHGASYNHPYQLFELFPELRRKVETAYFENANHTFTELDEQAEMIALVSDWMARFR